MGTSQNLDIYLGSLLYYPQVLANLRWEVAQSALGSLISNLSPAKSAMHRFFMEPACNVWEQGCVAAVNYANQTVKECGSYFITPTSNQILKPTSSTISMFRVSAGASGLPATSCPVIAG